MKIEIRIETKIEIRINIKRGRIIMGYNWSAAIKVNDISKEYRYVAGQECHKCGRVGSIKINLQKLVQNEDVFYDVLVGKCENCGEEYEFLFNVAAVFDSYKGIFKLRD